MHGQRIGYIRVSTLDQNQERQLDGAEWVGCSPTRPPARIRSDRSLERLRVQYLLTCWK